MIQTDRLKEYAGSIAANAREILSELETADKSENLFIVENRLRAIERTSKEANKYLTDMILNEENS